MKMQAHSRSAFKQVFILLVLLIGVRPSSSFAQVLEYPGELEWLSFVSSSLKRQPELILLEEGRNSLSFSLTVPGIYASHQDSSLGKFTILQAEGFAHTSTIGQPDLPVIRKLIAVPTGVDVHLSYFSNNELEINLSDLGHSDPLIPVQSCSEKCGDSIQSDTFNETVYGSQDYLSHEVVTILDDLTIRDQRYLLSEVRPISYNPSDNSIKVLPQITVTFSWDDSSLPYFTDSDELISNPLLLTATDQILNPPSITGSDMPSNIGYLIITPDAFEAALSPLISLKQSQGFTVTTAKLSQIGSTNIQIKSYIQNAYDKWQIPPSYLLLVGDTDNGSLSVPAWVGEVSGMVTDLYYSTTAGDDHLPDILLGRLPARNVEQLNIMINNIIAYEALSGNEEWIKEAAFLATGDSSNYWISELTHNTLISTSTTQFGYSGMFPSDPQNGGDKLYAYSYLANNTNVINAINDERSLIVFSGHGNSVAWGTPG
ncbi:MAG: C25 family cysteine peptidase, partial [Anaerolineaceae bacterium]|nr:C25 family cysteine peptidase [Anaerolineaceae bacterium]